MDLTHHLLDTTLRDGEQGVGIALSIEDKLAIHKQLFNMGVRRFELGCPAMGGQELEAIQEIVRRDSLSELSVWCRACEKDLVAALGTGVQVIHTSFPTSPLQRKVWGWDFLRCYEALDRLSEVVGSSGCMWSVGAQDASRESLENLLNFGRRAQMRGAFRWRIADTVGAWSPLDVLRKIGILKQELAGLQIDFHGHNDLGMATANAVTAIAAGADMVSVTVGGIGERSGNAALEEVAVALVQGDDPQALHTLVEHGGPKYGIDFAQMTSCCRSVAKIMGRSLPAHKPIVGARIFEHESGIHCAGLLNDNRSYNLISPEAVGGPSAVLALGKHSGRQGLRFVLESLRLYYSREIEMELLASIQNFAIEHRRSPEREEIRLLISTLESSRQPSSIPC